MPNPFENKRVLIAENTAPIRQLIVSELKNIGFKIQNIHQAENGVKAVIILLKNDLDLILSEFNLPKMDGLTFLKKVRSLKSAAFTSFLMMTGEADLDKKTSLLDQAQTSSFKSHLRNKYFMRPFRSFYFLKSNSNIKKFSSWKIHPPLEV
jgi:two-component system, chemotaxis family, chemotaxis protein CheY